MSSKKERLLIEHEKIVVKIILDMQRKGYLGYNYYIPAGKRK